MQFDELTKARRSVRAYKKVNLDPAKLAELMQAVLQAPTWKNSQTGRYYFAYEAEAVEKVRACLPGFNQNSTNNASAYVVTTFVKDIAGFSNGEANNEPGNEWGAYDLGLQNAYLILKASDLGLDTLIMGLRDAAQLRSVMSIPENEEVMAVIAIGERDGEPVIRQRKQIGEISNL